MRRGEREERPGPDGKLVAVCPGTGQAEDDPAYLDRPAINGPRRARRSDGVLS